MATPAAQPQTPRSERRLFKATLVVPAAEPQIGTAAPARSGGGAGGATVKGVGTAHVGRAIDKTSFLQAIKINRREVGELQKLAAAEFAPAALRVVRREAGRAIDVAALAGRDRVPPALSAAANEVAKIHPATLEWLGDALVTLRNADAENAKPVDAEKAKSLAAATSAAVGGFTATMKIQPVGRLHLERIHMNPVGIERGALLYSVAMAPSEVVNITHREWSVKSEEFEKIVKDELENFSEEGVTDKTDIAQATESESKHATAINVGASLSASYSSVTLTSSFGMSMQDETEQSRKDSVAHSTQVTKKAASRTRRDHKTSFKVSSASGQEDQAVRVIKNPSPTHTMRVDYYELMRKWRVDLYRYGLRMTYDIAIPSPGSDLIRLLEEVRRIDESLSARFEFVVPFGNISVNTWPQFAAEHQIAVDMPPPGPLVLRIAGKIEAVEGAFGFGRADLQVPDGYEVQSASFRANVHVTDDHFADNHRAQFRVLGEPMPPGAVVDAGGQFKNKDGEWDAPLTNATLVGMSGSVTLPFRYYNVDSGDFVLDVTVTPRTATINEWRLKAWTTIKQAAEDDFMSRRETLKDRRDRLQKQIDQFDTLTLRRMEHEEVMKGVLRWLLGPGFAYVPVDVLGLFKQDSKDPQALARIVATTDADWRNVLLFGEFVKYVHQAIEWENMLYFPYPYFWDHPDNWPSKLFLYHTDSVHRTFLRAGSARVVLTVRPGFEKSFAALLDGGFNAVQDTGFPYVTIAQEIEAFAKTNYPGIPPANGVDEFRTLLSRPQLKTWDTMQAVMKALEEYKIANGSYPTTAQGLAVLANVGSTTDEWGKALVYTCPGVHAEFDLASKGANGMDGGEGDDADIMSWAEASLVGRWYDYTPTAAMDIGVDTAYTDLT